MLVAHDSLLLGRGPGGEEVSIPAYGDSDLRRLVRDAIERRYTLPA